MMINLLLLCRCVHPNSKICLRIGYSMRVRQFSDLLTKGEVCMASVLQLGGVVCVALALCYIIVRHCLGGLYVI